MREKYESLALVELKEVARARGLKGTSAMKKANLIELMLQKDEEEKNAGVQEEIKSESYQPKKEMRPVPVSRMNTVPRTEPGVRRTESRTGGGAGESRDSRYVSRSTDSRSTDSRSTDNRSTENRSIENRSTENKSAENRGTDNRSTESRSADNRSAENRGTDNRSTESRSTDNRSAENRSTDNRNTDNRSTDSRTSEEERFPSDLDSGITVKGILEVMPDGYGFIRSANYLPGDSDVYVAPSQIRRFNLKTGDILEGNTRVKTQNEKFSALLFVKSINGYHPDTASRRKNFEDMTPIFPNERIRLETPGASVAMRIMDLMSPVGKGQRGMIVSPPKAGKTTLLKEVAHSVKVANPNMHLLILLIDERPEEVTDIREAIEGPNVEVIYSTFDELPEHHRRVAEMVNERAKRLVEHRKDVTILIDSITRLTRAYNLVVPPSGRTLSGGLDPAALHMPKRFFGAARNMREGGSLTILATALVETGSKMDDVIYEEFKGTGNMEMVLDRKLSEKRVFPAIDIPKSGTRREDLLLTQDELEAINIIRKAFNGMKSDEAVDKVLDMFTRTRSNYEFVNMVKKMRFL